MKNEMMIFNNKEFGQVRTLELDGRLYFVGLDVARALGYSNPSKAVIQHCKGITKMVIPSNGGEQETNCIPEGDLYRLITHSQLPSAEKFEEWVFDEVLPSIRRTGGYKSSQSRNISFKEQIEAVGVVAEMLRVNEVGKVSMIESHFKSYGLPTDFLPAYISNGNREYRSLTELLDQKAAGISAIAFNKRLIEWGILEEKERKSSKAAGVKKFKVLTEKGLRYGENFINPKNQKEANPRYYVDIFDELLKMVL